MEAMGSLLRNQKILTMESESPFEFCNHCGGKKRTTLVLLGKRRSVPVLCPCKEEALKLEREQMKQREAQIRLERLRSYSLMDENFAHCTFENWIRDTDNEKLLALGGKYHREWTRMKKENIGLLLWGEPGTGKSYFSFCVANALLGEFVPVIAISSIGLLSRIKATYNSYGKEGEIEIIQSLKNASLLILDDLGAENGTDWSHEKLYEVIDSRYRLGKPMIVTTNLTLEGLKNKLMGRDGIHRTYDRLMEMCIPIQVKGKSRRAQSGKQKTMIFKRLLEEI